MICKIKEKQKVKLVTVNNQCVTGYVASNNGVIISIENGNLYFNSV